MIEEANTETDKKWKFNAKEQTKNAEQNPWIVFSFYQNWEAT